MSGYYPSWETDLNGCRRIMQDHIEHGHAIEVVTRRGPDR